MRYNPKGTQVTVSLMIQDDKVLIDFSDDGIGIPDQLAAMISSLCPADDSATQDRRQRLGAFHSEKDCKGTWRRFGTFSGSGAVTSESRSPQFKVDLRYTSAVLQVRLLL